MAHLYVLSYDLHKPDMDYKPEKTGCTVFINDCRLAHPVVVEELADGKPTVILHAGGYGIDGGHWK